VNMPLHIEYAWITNQIFHSFSPTVKMFQSWMSDAYSSLCIQTDYSQCWALAQQLQQHTIEICCKMILISYQELMKQIILHCRQNGLSSFITWASFVICLIVSRHNILNMLVHWHIHMVHFLLFLHRYCGLVTGSLINCTFKFKWL